MPVALAGLVLAANFLPRWWQRLELLDSGGRAFRDPAAAARAVQLLHWLAGAGTDTPDHRLTLARLLCALPAQWPVPLRLQLSQAERETGEALLRALIQHWKAIGKTSPAGLRESFLARPGLLQRRGDAGEGWLLRVESRAFDMLLDQLPWAFRTLRFPWMDEVLHVEWR